MTRLYSRPAEVDLDTWEQFRGLCSGVAEHWSGSPFAFFDGKQHWLVATNGFLLVGLRVAKFNVKPSGLADLKAGDDIRFWGELRRERITQYFYTNYYTVLEYCRNGIAACPFCSGNGICKPYVGPQRVLRDPGFAAHSGIFHNLHVDRRFIEHGLFAVARTNPERIKIGVGGDPGTGVVYFEGTGWSVLVCADVVPDEARALIRPWSFQHYEEPC